jgi:hypothetical protein
VIVPAAVDESGLSRWNVSAYGKMPDAYNEIEYCQVPMLQQSIVMEMDTYDRLLKEHMSSGS